MICLSLPPFIKCTISQFLVICLSLAYLVLNEADRRLPSATVAAVPSAPTTLFSGEQVRKIARNVVVAAFFTVSWALTTPHTRPTVTVKPAELVLEPRRLRHREVDRVNPCAEHVAEAARPLVALDSDAHGDIRLLQLGDKVAHRLPAVSVNVGGARGQGVGFLERTGRHRDARPPNRAVLLELGYVVRPPAHGDR